MNRRTIVAVALVALVALAGCQGPLASDTTAPAPTTAPTTGTTTTAPTATDEPTTTTTGTPIEDPATDRLGWEGGLWYNESITVDRSDGLNDTELAAVVNRSMARVEHIRKLEFEHAVPVSIITRSEFRNRTASSGDPSRNATLHQNVKYEALFMVGENENALAELRGNTASTVLGYYSPSREEIVIVSENTESPSMNEITLAQELFHALQDQTFDLSQYEQSTTETHNAVDGIIEGDGNYVDYLYEQRCEQNWDCLMPQSSGSGNAADIHVGIYAITFQPYSDGPPFVQNIRQQGGWAAVNEVYANPPASTEQTIHPAKYEEDAPTEVTIEDTSSNGWSVPDLGPNSVDYAKYGEAGMYVMLWYQSFLASQEAQAARTVAIPYRSFFSASGELDAYNYDHPMTAGWDGDKLYPYVRADSGTTNETGYVWKSVWDSPEDAQQFAEGYLLLLEHFDATQVSTDTYRVPDGKYADAFYVHVEGDTVVVVNAPTVDALGDVHASAA